MKSELITQKMYAHLIWISKANTLYLQRTFIMIIRSDFGMMLLKEEVQKQDFLVVVVAAAAAAGKIADAAGGAAAAGKIAMRSWFYQEQTLDI